jgi:hypothetical protein
MLNRYLCKAIPVGLGDEVTKTSTNSMQATNFCEVDLHYTGILCSTCNQQLSIFDINDFNRDSVSYRYSIRVNSDTSIDSSIYRYW